MSDMFRTTKAILKNALLWGVTLGLFSGTLIALYVFIVPGPEATTFMARVQGALLAGVAMGVRFAFAAAVMGAFFATALRFLARGRRIAELHVGKAALIGAIVGGVGIPLFYQLLNILSGDGPVAWKFLFDDIPWAAIFGASAAAGTIWLARRATALPQESTREQLGGGAEVDAPSFVREEKAPAKR